MWIPTKERYRITHTKQKKMLTRNVDTETSYVSVTMPSARVTMPYVSVTMPYASVTMPLPMKPCIHC
jgi:hypothetical protein